MTDKPLRARRAEYGAVRGTDRFGDRSVRFAKADGGGGLATATYSFHLSHEERCEVARRIAVLWNLFPDASTDDLEKILAAKMKDRK